MSLIKPIIKTNLTFSNNIIYIGKNKEANDQLVKNAKDSDYWFHLDAYPSCHIILESSIEFPITNEMIVFCANLVKQNTKYKNIPKLKVIYCEIKNVTRTKELGKVIVKQSKNIII